MNKHWKNILQHLQKNLESMGIDVVVPFNKQWYNEVVPVDMQIPTFPLSGNQSFGVMIGNTKRLWHPLIDYLSTLEQIPSHPVTQYVIEAIQMAVVNAKKDGFEVPCKTYWAHETQKGKLIGAQKLAQVSGYGILNEESHLCINPIHGTWFSIRGVLFFDIEGPSTKPEQCHINLSEERRQKIREILNQAIQNIENRPHVSTDNWKKWLASRNAVCPNHPFMFSDAQTWYHYNHGIENAMQLLVDYEVEKKKALEEVIPNYTIPEQVIKIRQIVQSVLRDLPSSNNMGLIHSHPLADAILMKANSNSFYKKGIFSTSETILKFNTKFDVWDDNFKDKMVEYSGKESEFLELILNQLKNNNDSCQSYVIGCGIELLFSDLLPRETESKRFHLQNLFQNISKLLDIRIDTPFLDARLFQIIEGVDPKNLPFECEPVPNGISYKNSLLRQAFPEVEDRWQIFYRPLLNPENFSFINEFQEIEH